VPPDRNAKATTPAATRVRAAAMVAVGAMPESNAARAESINRSASAGGRVCDTDVAPLMLSLASADCASVRPPGNATLDR